MHIDESKKDTPNGKYSSKSVIPEDTNANEIQIDSDNDSSIHGIENTSYVCDEEETTPAKLDSENCDTQL